MIKKQVVGIPQTTSGEFVRDVRGKHCRQYIHSLAINADNIIDVYVAETESKITARWAPHRDNHIKKTALRVILSFSKNTIYIYIYMKRSIVQYDPRLLTNLH